MFRVFTTNYSSLETPGVEVCGKVQPANKIVHFGIESWWANNVKTSKRSLKMERKAYSIWLTMIFAATSANFIIAS